MSKTITKLLPWIAAAGAGLLLLKKPVSGCISGTFSPNRKTNAWYRMVYNELQDFDAAFPGEIRHYYNDYRREPDYKIAAHGNLTFSNEDLRQMMLRAGYAKSTVDRMSYDQIWDYYRRTVGQLVRQYFI